MADYAANISSTTELDDSLVLAFEQNFLVAAGQENVMDDLVQYNTQIGATSIKLTKYPRLAVSTTPLVEKEQKAAQAMSDTGIILTPKEYGEVITTTKLANLQSGGKVDLAAAELVGLNFAETENKLAVEALDASTNSYIIGGTAAGSVAANQVASRTFFNYFFNKLARQSVQKINGMYVAVLHDDVIADLRADVAAGGWIAVNQYANVGEVLSGEVGTFAGFRIVRNNAATYADQTGAGTVDLYNSYFLGANALGKAVSEPGHLTITGPFDTHARFLNIGWYAAETYGIIDQDSVWVGRSASSVAPGNAI